MAPSAGGRRAPPHRRQRPATAGGGGGGGGRSVAVAKGGMGLGAVCLGVAALVAAAAVSLATATAAQPVAAAPATMPMRAAAAVAPAAVFPRGERSGGGDGGGGGTLRASAGGGDDDGGHGGGGGGGHHPAPNPRVVEVLGISLVVFQALLHATLHALEGWLTAAHPGLLPALRVLYRELLILGVVSLALVIVVTFGSLPAGAVASFEFAHLLIFALAILYTATVLVVGWASSVLSRRWRRLEALPLDTYLAYKEEYNALRARRHRHANALWRAGGWAGWNPAALLRFSGLHEAMTFHDIRFQQIFYRDLPTDFAFGAYLNRVKGSLFTSLVEVPATSWAALLPLILADMARRGWAPGEGGASRVDRYVLLGLSAATALVVEGCRWKIGRVYWHLFRHPATYFNHPAAATAAATDDDEGGGGVHGGGGRRRGERRQP